MKTQNFTYQIKTTKTPEQLFKLLLDVRQWWIGFYEETIEGKSQQVNDEFIFKAGGGAHYTKQKLVELVPDKRVSWLVTESELTFLSDPTEWKNSRFGFDINTLGNVTEVTFTHEGLTPEAECYNQCSAGWTSYLGELKRKLS